MDEHQHHPDITIDHGRRFETRPWIVEADDHLGDTYDGGICVHDDAQFTIEVAGTHNGSLVFRPGSVGRILGTHNGSLHVAAGADVEVIGAQNGSVHVEDGAELRTAPRSRLAGSLHVAGLIINRGVRGGTVHLAGGEIRDIDGGVEKPPVVRDGASWYQW